MNRLTERDFVFNSDYISSRLQSWSIAQALGKLQEYENLEEDNRLLKLPCSIGTSIYMVVESRRPLDSDHVVYYVKNTILTELNCFRVMSDFGKTVFLSRCEAVAAKERMEAALK